MPRIPSVNVATFSEWVEAEGLRAALERQGIEASVVVEGGWLRYLFSRDSARVHVQVPEDCCEEA